MADVTISPHPSEGPGEGAGGESGGGASAAATPRPPPSGAVMTLRLPVVVRSGLSDAASPPSSRSSARLASVSASHAAAATAAAVAARAADKLAKEKQAEEESGVRRTPSTSAEAPPPLMAQRSAPAPPPAAPNVLLIEDHPLNQKLMRKLLEKHGWAVDVAADGVQGLAMLQAALAPHPPGVGDPPPPRKPDLVLCDLQMCVPSRILEKGVAGCIFPSSTDVLRGGCFALACRPNMNGYEMTRAFRDWCAATQPPGFHLPVVAISADVMDEQVMKCEEAGFDGASCQGGEHRGGGTSEHGVLEEKSPLLTRTPRRTTGHLSKPLQHDMFQLLRNHITPAA